MKCKPRYFGIDYSWMENGEKMTGRTVATGITEDHARARFQRTHPHVTAIAPGAQ